MQLKSAGVTAFSGVSAPAATKAVNTVKEAKDPKDSVSINKGHSDEGDLKKMKQLQDMKWSIRASAEKNEKPGEGKGSGENKETEKKPKRKLTTWEQIQVDRAKNAQKVFDQWEKYILGK